MNSNDTPEPWLSPDFAARVMLRADVFVARRRARRAVAGLAAASFATIAIASWAGLSRFPDAFGVRREPVYVGVPPGSPANQADEADALSYLFPDAAPVARFAAQYSDADDDAGVDTDAISDRDADTR